MIKITQITKQFQKTETRRAMENVDSYKSPSWLTPDYIERILQKSKQNANIKIKQISIKPATAKGDNYASIMTRVDVSFESANANEVYLIKSTYDNDAVISKLMASYAVMQTEMLMYEKVLPALNKLLQQIDDHDQLFAQTMHVDYEHDAIMFQDLTPLNYGIGDRLLGMSLQQAKMALGKLAKMHATGAVWAALQPELSKKLVYGIINEHAQGFIPFFSNTILAAANFARHDEHLGEYYYEKLLKLQPHIQDYAWQARKPKAWHFNTLIHGDYWFNNIMLRKDASSNIVQDMIIIDFQFCCWAPATIDLHYFLNTSLKGGLNEQNEGALLQHYHAILQKTLLRLNFHGHIPTLHELWVQYEDSRFYGLTSALVNQPLMINGKTENADLHALIGNDERSHNFRKLLYENPVMQQYCRKLLPMFDQRGLLDVRK